MGARFLALCAVVASAGAVIGLAATQDACALPPNVQCGAAAGQANVWVDGGAGSCTYSATLLAYNSVTACANFTSACSAVPDGTNALVLVKAGTYGEQDLACERTGGIVTFQPSGVNPAPLPSSASPVIIANTSTAAVQFQGSDFIRLSGFTFQGGVTWKGSGACCTDAPVNDGVSNSQIDVGVALFSSPDSIATTAQGLTYTGNVIGPSIPSSISCSPNCASPEGLRIGKPTTAAPACSGETSTEACFANITGNKFQYTVRDCTLWPSSGFGSCPGVTCANANGCHIDGIHVWGCESCTVAQNILYGDECQGIFFEPTNNSLNSDTRIVNNYVSTLAGGCGDKSIYYNANGSSSTSGTITIAFNSDSGQIQLGDGFAGCAALNCTFNLTGNASRLFVTNASGNNAGCNGGSPAGVTLNYVDNYWITAFGGGTDGPCSGSDLGLQSLPFLDNSAAPATTQNMGLTGADGSTNADQLVALATCGTIANVDNSGALRPHDGGQNCDAGGQER